jgi:hypothetical protein
MKDLPGQIVMPFAADAAAAAGAAQAAGRAPAAPAQLMMLPAKSTVTPPEAARILGVSVRQVRYLVLEGSLLAIDPGRQVVRNRDKAEDGRRRPWRVVVRRAGLPAQLEGAKGMFLTLEEFLIQRSNLEA